MAKTKGESNKKIKQSDSAAERPSASHLEATTSAILKIFNLIGTEKFSQRSVRSIILSSDIPKPIIEDFMKYLPKITSMYHSKESDEAFQLQRRITEEAILSENFALATEPTNIRIIDIIVKILGVIAAIIVIVDEIAAAPDTEKWKKHEGDIRIDSNKNVEVLEIVCNTDIKDVWTGLFANATLIIRKINKGCKVTIFDNHGLIFIEDNMGEVEIRDNHHIITIEKNNGEVDIDGNHDDILIDSNNKKVRVDGNEDTIAVAHNNGPMDVNANDDTISVGENNSIVGIDDNNDTINVGDNNGTVDVNGNRGGELDDADVNVSDNKGGTINANNNDGNINVTYEDGKPQGTINKGGNAGYPRTKVM